MKNNQPIPKAAFEKTPLSEILEENQIIYWISENGRALLTVFIFATLLLFTAYRFSSFGIVKSEINYINAENAFQRFILEKSNSQSEEALKELETILKAHPELHAKYDGQIAEKLLAMGKTTSSLPFARNALLRTTSENSPFYTNYSETALLIAEQKYEEALKRALNLNETMIKSEADNNLLFAFNLLRIGTLQGELLLKNEETATWNEWKKYASSSLNEPFKTVISQFNVGKLSLTDYIESRMNFLNSSQ